ncbi:MAG: phosphoribosylglycinamide formyltransferase [Elusimicrobia bacterium]|nr:phosphoribosylglycinamide formyltransferase [Elusimicrobiota bacterium]MBU2614091.1 phosphoribosylglycinamide formyltransferase [Elusimicrobiota bacterium]
MKKYKIGALVSGGGTNLQSIIDACESGSIQGEVAVVISSKKDAFALERAKKRNIPAVFIDRKQCKDINEFSQKVSAELKKRNVHLVCLAGFLLKLSPSLVKEYKNRILNVHPALLPAFGGEGMFGHHVHEAVLASGAKFTGPTVHFVDEDYDRGPIILQAVVPVLDDDCADSLGKRVLAQEHKIYPEAIRLFCENKLEVVGRRVIRRL